MIDTAATLYRALTLALPYLEKVAAMEPTEPARVRRQRQAVADLAVVRGALAAAHDAGLPTASERA